MEANEISSRLESAVAMLAEHCDSVQIVVTYRDTDLGDVMLTDGAGNRFARRGSTREWLAAEEAYTQGFEAASAKAAHDEAHGPGPDAGDGWKGGAR